MARNAAPVWLSSDWVPAAAHYVVLGLAIWQWLGLLLALALTALLGMAVEGVVLHVAHRVPLLRKLPAQTGGWRQTQGPIRSLTAILLVAAAPQALHLSQTQAEVVYACVRVGAIWMATWLALRLLRLGFARMAVRLEADLANAENQEARASFTRLTFLRQVLAVVLFLVAAAATLMQFEGARHLGVSLLASAGFAGLVLGVAAQRPLSNIFAGLLLTMTQPIRINDIVVVEGEWGSIELIRLTYVVVRIWDDRRLIVPITYFLEKPFENWSNQGRALLGTVFVYSDYRVDLQAMRQHLAHLVQSNPKWDQRHQSLAVTDLERGCVQVRVMVSAANANDLWDLRCQVREGLLGWLVQHDAMVPVQRRMDITVPRDA